MEHITLSLSQDQVHEIKQLIKFRKDSTAECPLCQEMVEFYDYLLICLQKGEDEFLDDSYLEEEGDVYA